MKLLEYPDFFFDKQPPIDFVEELKTPVHLSIPYEWGTHPAQVDEIDLSHGVNIVREFVDEKGLLNTAYIDFEQFLSVSGILNGTYPIHISYGETECFEAYRITANDIKCTLVASDTEGIRRGLVFLEDEMLRRGGPFLGRTHISRRPFIKTRITRCFFSPTNRPPKNGEELADDIDYYPEEYLNRLAHEGVNGIWIYTKFKDLLPSSIIPENGQNYENRIIKLNRTIEKCSRYGIKVYIFGVEPGSTLWNPHLLANHKDMLGNQWGPDFYAMCLSSKQGSAYAVEATRNLFTLAPDLAGLITITVGESNSHCASGSLDINCPNCKSKQPDQILAEAESLLAKGMHSVKPDAEYISWRYGQREWGTEATVRSAATIGDGAILMQNFEDLGQEEQLGKIRVAIDYFLSYAGPSRMFAESAKAARRSGKRVFAKIQVCNSHEVASIPYVPVPGILYKKYKAMRELGVDGVMQCWYFGNYPSVMNKAAGELAFEPFYSDEDHFLKHLAGIYWGADSEKAVSAWKNFEEGYRNFPINVGFTWYGPMHDGPVWPLQLIPKNLPLAGTWLTYEAVGGDRIGECLLNGHTLDEAIQLCEMMSYAWHKGAVQMESISNPGNEYRRNEQKQVAHALDCQFESGLNILRFYNLRNCLAYAKPGDQKELLLRMRDIVNREIVISRRLEELSTKDKRLGYHSEAEGYKYFPQKLRWRIEKLEALLMEEFPEVENRIAQGKVPFDFYYGDVQGEKKYKLTHTNIGFAPWENLVFEDQKEDSNSLWRASQDEDHLFIEIKFRDFNADEKLQIRIEFQLLWPYPMLYVTPKGEKTFEMAFYYMLHEKNLEQELNKWQMTTSMSDNEWKATFCIRKKDVDWDGIKPLRLNIGRIGQRTSKWVNSEYYCARLIFNYQNHNKFGWLISDINKNGGDNK